MSVADADFEQLSDRYAAERPRFENLAKQLARALEERLRARGLQPVVVCRAKTVQSFVKKALRKRYADPMTEIGDKAGVRVIVDFEADIDVVREVAEELCTIVASDAKRDAMAYNELGYLGLHLQVQPRAEALVAEDRVALLPLAAEIQVHTRAQSAWAVVSHDLLYKAPHELSVDVKRGVTRLVALVELFDAEIARFRSAIESDPDHRELAVIAPLDDEIVRFTARRPDLALSAILVPPLARLYTVEPERLYAEVLEPFIRSHEHELTALFEAYREDDRANPLLFQPEALLIFDLLGRDPDRLREAWPADRIPLELLESLETVWGTEL
jgi:ppGpp synthetase/RelA/SpoT-type nucleotidyltranferase